MKKYHILKSLSALAGFFAISLFLSACGGDKLEVSANSMENQSIGIKPDLKVYIENSGSMDGYMCDGSQLKDAVFDYVSDLNAYVDSTHLYYINNQEIPYGGDLEQYIKTLSPASFQKAGGNRSNSDLSKMLGMVLDSMNDTTVCIFVSDCILDLPVADAQRFLNTCRISIKNAVNQSRKDTPDLGIEILKLTSDFNGRYFYQNGNTENLADVKRPYYIWIFGNSKVLAKLNQEVPLAGLERYGLENIAAFSSNINVPFDIMNRSLTGPILSPVNGNYEATLRANLSSTLQPENVLQNMANYGFNNQALGIEVIKPITAEGSPYTHFINITFPKDMPIVEDNLILRAPALPEWIGESNDESGKDIRSNLDKTTGIKYLIGGVADAYKKDNILTTLKFTVKRK